MPGSACSRPGLQRIGDLQPSALLSPPFDRETPRTCPACAAIGRKIHEKDGARTRRPRAGVSDSTYEDNAGHHDGGHQRWIVEQVCHLLLPPFCPADKIASRIPRQPDSVAHVCGVWYTLGRPDPRSQSSIGGQAAGRRFALHRPVNPANFLGETRIRWRSCRQAPSCRLYVRFIRCSK